MAPKSSSSKKTTSALEKDEEAHYALSGIVLCDVGEENSLGAVNKDPLHPCLFPLTGAPILAYTLEFLERGGITDIVLICSRLSAQIESYLASSRWGERGYPVKVRVVVTAAIRSTGDALREIDRLGIAKSDFVLVRGGGILSNLPLPSIIEEHRKRRDEDKDAMLMTIVTLPTETKLAFNKRRNLHNARVYIFDENIAPNASNYDFQQCLLSERIEIYPDPNRIIHLSKQITSKHPTMVLRNDLYDVNIEICTPQVPAFFTENFDYEDLRRDFVNGVLTSDIISQKIYCYVPHSGYASSIATFDDYWNVKYLPSISSKLITSNDIVHGLTVPFDPSMNLENTHTYTKKGLIWREKNVTIDRSVNLKSVIIGSQTTISENATIVSSVIGRNCIIPANVTIENSILLDNVSLSPGVHIQSSIIAENHIAVAHVGEKLVLPPHTHPPTVQSRKSFVVQGQEIDSDSEDDVIPLDTLNLSDSDIETSDSDDDADEHDSNPGRSSSLSHSSDRQNEEFYTEAQESLSRAFDENHTIENAAIELKTLKMATNVTFHEVRQAVISALMDILVSSSGKVKSIFGKWGELVLQFVEDRDAERDLILITQRYFARRVRLGQVPVQKFVVALQALYQADVLEEERILEWFDKDDAARGICETWSDEMASLRKSTEGFITWLKEAEEESE